MALLQKLAVLWRIIGTVISFATFGLFGLILSFLFFPASRLFIRDPRKRRLFAQRSIQVSFILFRNWMRFLRAIDYRIENAELLREDDGCIIIANHPSLIDYVLITSLMPRCICIVKKPLWNNFFVKGVIRSAGYIPNDEVPNMLEACHAKLSDGGRILVFPEGTRSTPGQTLSLQRGAANLAVRCHADLRLIHITCTPPILTKQQPWWQTAPTRPLFVLSVKEKIPIARFTQNDALPSSAARLLNEHLAKVLRPDA